ncbi:hypothetical protein [Algibacillus agarilyticus]|uniref:hypothetical protein n=1 Tax=Algibacillus agarilyticus TaxID=2234133 RepID=UPI001300992C|nr:hypothetical protein [Algibacillus agarilyticus]
MYELNKMAINQQYSGNYKLARATFDECISKDPSDNAITNNRARRWCQNNLIAMINSCEIEAVCDKSYALNLANSLYKYNEYAKIDDHYAINIADTFYLNGDKKRAIEVLDHIFKIINPKNVKREIIKKKLHQWKGEVL